MPRRARIVLPGIPHHVTHRGNLGSAVFSDEADRIDYLERLNEAAHEAGTEVWCYCLMDNHVHLILTPRDPDSLARTIRATHRFHAARMHLKSGLRGHLWSERYYSAPLDERHLWVAARYVELNPVRAHLVDRAQDYRWSSARSHAFRTLDPVLSPGRPFPGNVGNWAAFLAEGLDQSDVERVRERTRNGRPCGSEEFVLEVEAVSDRYCSPRPSGRPRKPAASLFD